ncbi:MAG: sulfatase-like hydrolase/transferase [Muribaculaceae bacterium]|nr:sulfatase-like hydrolase/transferase [Muribaculaceae bacterium]
MKDLCQRIIARLKRYSTNPSFLFYALAIVVMTAQMVITSHRLAEGAFYPMPLMRTLIQNHLGDALLLTAFYWLLPARRKGWLWLMVGIVTVWCFAQITYNETYRDMMPFSSWLYVSNLGGVLFDSILGTITAEAVWVLVLPLLLLAVYLWKFRKRVSADKSLCRRGWILSLVAIALWALLQFAVLVQESVHNKTSLKEYFPEKYYSLVNFNNKVYPVKNGNVAYVIYSIAKSFTGITAEQRQEAQEFIDNEVPKYTDNTYCVTENRNLVLLMVESLNAWVVGLEIDGREVCPVLNSLVNDSASISCTQMMAQVKNGRSSDGMFIYNIGILPLTTQSVAMDYGENEYPSLSKALKTVNPQYRSIEITVDRTGMWNVENTARSYGFDELCLQDTYREAYLKSGESIDKALLEFSSGKLGAQQLFYAMIFTGTTHVPYNKLEDVKPTWISQSKEYTVNVRNYLEKVAFFDQQLGAFLQRLKDNGLYDNTVIIVASDHSDFIDDDPQGRASLSKRGIECVFVILNSGLAGKRIEGPVGQIDIYPTLLDIMGANAYWWKGLGHSLLRNDIHSAVPAPGETAGDTSSPIFHHQNNAWQVSNTLIKTNWWKKR